MNPEDKLATLFTLQEIGKAITQITEDVPSQNEFKSQHQLAFDTIKKIGKIDNWVCDCGNHYPSEEMIGKYHTKLREFLTEICNNFDSIETEWFAQEHPQEEEQIQEINSILSYLRGLKIACEIEWSKNANQVVRTIAFFRKGNILQQMKEIMGTKSEITFRKKDEKEFEDLSYWQRNVLKNLN